MGKSKLNKIFEKIVDVIKSPLCIVIAFVITAFIILLSSVIYQHNPSNQYICPCQAQIAKELLSNQITYILTVFGSSFAILAIIFSMIQYNKEYEEVLSILFEETYLFPYFGFVSATLLYAIAINTAYNLNWIDIITLKSIIVPLSIGFILQIIFLFVLIFRIYKLQLNDNILMKYIDRAKKIIFNKKLNYLIEIENNKTITKKQRKRLETGKRVIYKLNRVLFQNLKLNIYSDDQDLINKITDVYSLAYLNNYYYFINGYPNKIYTIFDQVFSEKNGQLLVNSLSNIIRINNKIINGLIDMKPNLFLKDNITELPKHFYNLIQENVPHNAFLKEDLLQGYKNILDSFEKRTKSKDYSFYKQFYIKYLNIFSDFLKIVVDNIDLKNFRDGFAIFNQINSDIHTEQESYNLYIEKCEMTNWHRFGLFAWCLDLYLRGELIKEDFEKFNNIIEKVVISKIPINASDLNFIASNNQGKEFEIWIFWINPRENLSLFSNFHISDISSWLMDTYVVILLENDFSTFVMEDLIKNNLKVLSTLSNASLFYSINESINNVDKKYKLKISELYSITEPELQERIDFLREFFKKLKAKFDEKNKNIPPVKS